MFAMYAHSRDEIDATHRNRPTQMCFPNMTLASPRLVRQSSRTKNSPLESSTGSKVLVGVVLGLHVCADHCADTDRLLDVIFVLSMRAYMRV